jgi:Peptidase M66
MGSTRIIICITLLIALVTACQNNSAPIQKPPVPSFHLTLEPASLELIQGDATEVTVKLERLGGFSDSVAVSFKGLPADVTLSPTSLSIDATASSATVLLTASATAAIASSSVTLEGVGGTLKNSASLNLTTVKPDPSRPDLFVKRLEWGQSVLKPDLRLLPGKAAVLRAFVNATQAGMTGVIVRATASVGGVTLGTLDLGAPTSVPTTDTATELASTYWGVLPKEWIKTGLEVKLTVDAGRSVKESNEANNTQILKPAVGTGNTLYLMMVPIIQGGKTALTLDAAAAAELKSALMRYWPLADVDIQVRAPYTITTNDGFGELVKLRDADGSKRYYYGFEESCCGVGSVGYPVSAGNANPWTIAHELGHNFGMLHAPCGADNYLDANYPVKDGKIDSWGFDPRDNSLVNPAKYNDLMGYCGTTWVSDYMYRKVQLFLEQYPSGDKVSAATSALLLVSGTVKDGQISLEPMQRITGVASAPTSGPYNLSLETTSGTKRVSFDLHRATHQDGTGKLIDNAQFSFTMPDPGGISKATVGGYGVASLQQSAKVALARVQSLQPMTVQRSGSSVTVSWDAAVYSSVAVAHIAPDGTRTTLALGLTGGKATLELGALGAGQFEVSASDGLNGVKQRF